jgi:aminomethyltransferase
MALVDHWVTPTRRGGAIVPGLPRLRLGVERYVVPACGSVTVELQPGDGFALIDPQGGQSGELLVFDKEGRTDAGLIAASDGGPPDGLMDLLGRREESAARLRRLLASRGVDLSEVETVKVLGPEARAGVSVSFIAQETLTLVAAAPGAAMQPFEQTPPGSLTLFVERANPQNRPRRAAPAPRAGPILDATIDPGTARAYEVKAGEWIQILDVQGRECSDFQAFALRSLECGLLRDIDPTTTRTLNGSLYPMPGLAAKYFSVDHEPLLEVVQDTCGRHDTFGLACTARYYEDQGYPGHVNCSDNLNRAAVPYGIAPRAGWPAINFFFNTRLDSAHLLGQDDPWSRPGDYVLLRALTDLVCFSSACPDDIDPSNAWDPTEIQLRVYKANESFSRAVAWRATADAEPKMTEETAFHSCFARHTRDFGEYKGYWLAGEMTGRGAVEEYWACREKAAVMDLSPLRKYEVLGPDAEALLQRCLTRDVKRLSGGQLVYTAMCYEHGGMIDDGTLLRLSDNAFRWIGGCETSGLWLREQAEALGLDAWVREATDQLHNIALQGPLSRDILKGLLWTPPGRPSLEELGWFRLTVARIGGFEGIPLVVTRSGYTGELGYEIFCHPKDAEAVFDAVWQAGEPLGLAPLGLKALDMLRIEAGLIAADAEFCDRTDPFEAGIGFTVPLKTKQDDFIGRAALEQRAAHPQRRLMGLKVEGGTLPVRGDAVCLGRARVGEVTSAVRSPQFGVIALARLDVTQSAPGTALEVGQLDGYQKRLPATVTTIPFYDPKKQRVRA